MNRPQVHIINIHRHSHICTESWGARVEAIMNQSPIKKTNKIKTKQNRVNTPQQHGLQLESMYNFTDRLYCIPRITTGEGERKQSSGLSLY